MRALAALCAAVVASSAGCDFIHISGPPASATYALPPLGIGHRTPGAFSDAYALGLDVASRSIDATGLHFHGADRSRIAATGKAGAGGRWCFYFYSSGKEHWYQVLLSYNDDDTEPKITTREYAAVFGERTEIDPGTIRVDSDEAIGKVSGFALADEDNVRLEARKGPDGAQKTVYVFVPASGPDRLVNATTGALEP